jgi:hypothetical protein
MRNCLSCKGQPLECLRKLLVKSPHRTILQNDPALNNVSVVMEKLRKGLNLFESHSSEANLVMLSILDRKRLSFNLHQNDFAFLIDQLSEIHSLFEGVTATTA